MMKIKNWWKTHIHGPLGDIYFYFCGWRQSYLQIFITWGHHPEQDSLTREESAYALLYDQILPIARFILFF